MRTYRPGLPPEDPAQLPGFLRRELGSIQQGANRADPLVALTYITVAPTKPEDGLYLAAAGVLGVARGLYRYDSSVPVYTFIA